MNMHCVWINTAPSINCYNSTKTWVLSEILDMWTLKQTNNTYIILEKYTAMSILLTFKVHHRKYKVPNTSASFRTRTSSIMPHSHCAYRAVEQMHSLIIAHYIYSRINTCQMATQQQHKPIKTCFRISFENLSSCLDISPWFSFFKFK